MQVTVNNITHNVPFTLLDIPLGKFIEYYEQYGKDLDKQAEELQAKDYPKLLKEQWGNIPSVEDVDLHKNIDYDNHIDNEAISWFSFWTNTDLFLIKEDQTHIQPLLTQYRVLNNLIVADTEAAKNYPAEIEWNDETWIIQNYTVNTASEMTFNEVITSKEIMRQIHKLSKGRWDSLPYLCAIFLRKKDEPFEDLFITEGSDRLELMKTLPLSYAFQVAFFLSICVNTWKNTFLFSVEKNEAGKANLN